MIPPVVIKLVENLYPRWSPTMYRITLGTAVALAFIVPMAIVPIPMIEFFNGMAAQPKAKAQGTYGRVFGEQLIVERPPVPGAIPRGYHPYPFEKAGNTVEDAKNVGEQWPNPVPINEDTLRRGQKIYNTFCITCHGREGNGDGPVTGPNRFPAPPSLHTDQARGYADGAIYHIITKGMGKMPSYEEEIEPMDRWKAIHYVRALQRAANPKPEEIPQ